MPPTRNVTPAAAFPQRGRTSSASRQLSLAVQVIDATTTLQALRREWDDLYLQAAERTVFQSFGWVFAWWRTVGRSSGFRLAIVVVRERGRPVLIWPLVKRRRGIWRSGSWAGAETGQYNDVLRADGEHRHAWLEAAWAHIRKNMGLDVIDFPALRDDGIVLPFLRTMHGSVGASEPAAVNDLPPTRDWAGWEKNQSRGFRKDLRRRRRRLAERGEVRFELVHDTAAIEEAVALAIEHKAAWLAARNLYGRFIEHPQATAWLTNACLSAHRNGMLHLAVLRLDGRVIACNIGFLDQGCLYNYLGSFDLAFRQYSPGVILTQDLLQWSFDNGVRMFDMMPPADDYKMRWCNTTIGTSAFLSFQGAMGLLAKAWYSELPRQAALNLYRRLPRSWRRQAIRWFGV